MDVQLSTRTVLELIHDPATWAACDRWSTRLAAQLSASPVRRPLAIAS
jgi:hypothetical protein